MVKSNRARALSVALTGPTTLPLPAPMDSHVGASVPPADVRIWPTVPFDNLVPAPETPPYIRSPPVVIGETSSKMLVFFQSASSGE